MHLPGIKVDLLASGRYHSILLVERLLAPIERDSLVGGGELIRLVTQTLIERLLALNLDGAARRHCLALLAFFTSCLHLASKRTFYKCAHTAACLEVSDSGAAQWAADQTKIDLPILTVSMNKIKQRKNYYTLMNF